MAALLKYVTYTARKDCVRIEGSLCVTKIINGKFYLQTAVSPMLKGCGNLQAAALIMMRPSTESCVNGPSRY